MSLIGGVIRNANTNVALPFANACITGTLTCASTDGYGIWNALWGYEGINVTGNAGGFHSKSVNFTSSDIAWYQAYGSYGYWKIIELVPLPPQPNCCFTGETIVEMANGDRRRIDQVRAGNLVIGGSGRVNRVIAIEQPLLSDRLLYSFNHGTPFVTSEHPFRTDSGWCAIDPVATALENRTLEVSRLEVGSSLVVASQARSLVTAGGWMDDVQLDLGTVRVETLNMVEAHPSTVLYNLLLDGDHSYIANGFVVHNKSQH